MTGHIYDEISSIKNLCQAWREFLRGKKHKPDVAEFALNLSANLYSLHQELKNKIYVHGPYQAFAINDPKPRQIHKSLVRDRLLHHAIYRVLYWHFDRLFIYDSYSCRNGKGTHRALDRFRDLARQVSESHSRTCWVLKCDIRKFFASTDHQVLFQVLRKHLADQDTLWLLGQVVQSFRPGLPLGNLTSQLLVNIYMNEFDQFVKHKLKARFYLRYADDFVFLSSDKTQLQNYLPVINEFLGTKLKLSLHPDKVFIKTLASGVDFLGWVHFPDRRVLRTVTKKRMFKRLAQKPDRAVIDSYLGLLGWGNGRKLQQEIGLSFA